MKSLTKSILTVVVGIAIGATGFSLFSDYATDTKTGSAEAEREPLYWVAPMDPNYRRDEPGQSPMGMDLIPVYAEGTGDDSPGTVRIDPDVVNNLGVTTARVDYGELDLNIETVGYVRFNEKKVVNVNPRVEGWIDMLHVKAVGEPVEAGEPLYTFYSPTLVNAQEEFLLALKRGNRVLIDAAEERLLALQVSKEDLERLRDTQSVSKTLTVSATQSGVLDKLTVREGDYIRPGMNLMTIGQLEHIWVIAEVFERQTGLVSPGDPVHMRLEYLPGKEWLGEVDYIYPAINPETRTTEVRIQLANPGKTLKPGMFAELTILTKAPESALIIPREALIRLGDKSVVVLALGEGKFKSVEVEVGRLGESNVEVLGGLMKGDQIVTSAQFLIDSESSKTSDFKRMNHDRDSIETTAEKMEMDDTKSSPQTVSVAATVTKVMAGHRMVTLQHAPIPEWDWPEMVMDFTVSDAIDLANIEAGMNVHVEISRSATNNLKVTEIHIQEQSETESQEQNND